ncbi:hypothetical protein CFC21_088979 [Triticum aestivum]|uniref:AT-rich interactive domain-containing protein 3 n=4 Tax=Triticum TaxID=4564 RepID=A0A9R0YTB8_TRITD|nr:AT-rich interactive domain-containing protein 5-like [Triticum aestivum]KAF7085565.1 hypothetical protein CFC21_088979 [Triticum aestivum]VAI60126.1 unnamed protein product [Triticum turgidum subsp. durum]
MSDGADSDRDLPRADGDDEPRHPDPRAAKEEEPPVADEFQDAPPSPETNSDGDGERSPDRAGLPNAGDRGETAPPDAGEEAVGVRVETNGEDAMSHDGDEGDGEDEDDDEDDDDEEDDEDEDDDSTPDASPRAEVKAEGDGSAGLAQCASQQPVEPDPFLEGHDSGTEEEQAAFMSELERFHREHSLEFKPPKFYGKGLNCLKLWRQVAHLGGHEQVTVCKLWRQVGETFRPPKTCTTVSWSFRIFYEKALLEYEKHKVRTGQLKISIPAIPQPGGTNREGVNASSSARIRRDAAARAMQGWHAHRLLANDMYGDHIFKDKDSIPLSSRDKNLKGFGVLKRKKASSPERAFKVSRTKVNKSQEDSMVIDVGEPADWVKINVRQTKECFEIYALVPGLLREEVHVQSDPAGRLVITGDPDQPDNPWGITAFKKVINLPLRIDPHQTSAVVTLHGQLFVRAPFGHPDM